jgi:hypothetical protein
MDVFRRLTANLDSHAYGGQSGSVARMFECAG